VLTGALAGFVPRERELSTGTPRAGLRATWADSFGREFTILSGVEGELRGADTGQQLQVRGHSARLLENEATDTRFAVWREAPEGLPCSQYAAIATGLSDGEFRAYVQLIR
jgi:hypothetical protein